MEPIKSKLRELIEKYKYALLILLIGIALMVVPSLSTKQNSDNMINVTPAAQTNNLAEDLEKILSGIDGAGRVEVMLTISQGEQTFYQADSDYSNDDSSTKTNSDTVIITDKSKNENGLVTRVDPVKYMGAVVLCQGADSPTIRLSIIDAVSKVTGLGANQICVLKMK